MLREVRFSDLAFNFPDQIKWNPAKRRFFNSAATSKNEYDDEGEGGEDTADPNQIQVDAPSLPKKPNPLLVAMYGQSCTSYQSAMCMFHTSRVSFPIANMTSRLSITGV